MEYKKDYTKEDVDNIVKMLQQDLKAPALPKTLDLTSAEHIENLPQTVGSVIAIMQNLPVCNASTSGMIHKACMLHEKIQQQIASK